MELPFLKNKKNMGGGGSAPTITRQSDTSNSQALLEIIWDEFIDAIEKKDRQMGLDALRALVTHIQDEDGLQDEDME